MLKRFALWVLVAALLWGGALAQAEDEGFFRMDRDSRQAWKGQVANLRLLTKGQYTFGKAKPRYRIDADYTPSVKGLNRLNISGSAQFSEPQFHQLAVTLRKLAKGRRIYVIDLRQESHVFINGNPISWFEAHNWANAGRTLAQIQREETLRFGGLVGSTIHAYGVSHDQKSGPELAAAVADRRLHRIREGHRHGPDLAPLPLPRRHRAHRHIHDAVRQAEEPGGVHAGHCRPPDADRQRIPAASL